MKDNNSESQNGPLVRLQNYEHSKKILILGAGFSKGVNPMFPLYSEWKGNILKKLNDFINQTIQKKNNLIKDLNSKPFSKKSFIQKNKINDINHLSNIEIINISNVFINKKNIINRLQNDELFAYQIKKEFDNYYENEEIKGKSIDFFLKKNADYLNFLNDKKILFPECFFEKNKNEVNVNSNINWMELKLWDYELIFTFNYDLLIENLFPQLKNIYHIHGTYTNISKNWTIINVRNKSNKNNLDMNEGNIHYGLSNAPGNLTIKNEFKFSIFEPEESNNIDIKNPKKDKLHITTNYKYNAGFFSIYKIIIIGFGFNLWNIAHINLSLFNNHKIRNFPINLKVIIIVDPLYNKYKTYNERKKIFWDRITIQTMHQKNITNEINKFMGDKMFEGIKKFWKIALEQNIIQFIPKGIEELNDDDWKLINLNQIII